MQTSKNLPKPNILTWIALCRLNRPIGIWLVLFPCLWGLALAGASQKRLWFASLFGLGAILMRSVGCIYNDWVDRKLDAHVERTKMRPLACGAISSTQAWALMAILSLTALVLLLQFPPLTIGLGLCSVLLVALYPWMKRISYWPQAFLGLTFNWGALMGWSAIHNNIDPPALWLYAAGICWTLIYDTIYAHQDKEDDLLVGIKSSALRLGSHTKPFLTVTAALMVVFLGVSGWTVELGMYFFVGLIGVALHLAWQIASVDLDHPQACLAKFKSNQWLGLLVLGAIFLGSAY